MTVRSNKQVIDAWVLEGIFGRGNRSSGLISIGREAFTISDGRCRQDCPRKPANRQGYLDAGVDRAGHSPTLPY